MPVEGDPLTGAAAPASNPWPAVLGSTAGAALALAAALWLTRAAPPDAWYGSQQLALTPERAAESFIQAYLSGALDRAAHLSTGELSRSLLAQAKQAPTPPTGEPGAFVVEESHRLDNQRLRLVGVMVRDGDGDSEDGAGSHVSLTLVRHKSRYLVQEIVW